MHNYYESLAATSPRLLVLLVYTPNYREWLPVVVHRHVLPLHVYFVQQLLESTAYIGVRNSWGLYKFHILVLWTQVTCFLLGYLPLPWVLLHNVYFVTYQHDADVLFGLSQQRFNPELHIWKGFPMGNIVDDEASKSFSVVGNCDGTVLFLPSCVPKLSLYCCTVLHDHILCSKFYSNGGTCTFGQLVF